MNAIHGSILLADDEEKILKRLGRALRDEGHEVVETTSARGAQKQLMQSRDGLLAPCSLRSKLLDPCPRVWVESNWLWAGSGYCQDQAERR